MKTTFRKIYMMIGTCVMPAAAYAATGEPAAIDSTMNALDYVLQRPAPAEKFPQKRFGDRLFISAEAGPDWMRTNANLTGASLSDNGYRIGLTIGDWITPVHGWRLGLSAGRHNGVKDTRPFFAGLSLDYMMNLSALLRKDNPSRRFELIGIMGLEGQALHRDGHRLWGAAGARIGLQPRLYVTSSTYLYVEPRIGIYTDGLDDVKTWHHYDWNASVMVGLGYRMTGGRGISVDNSLFSNDYVRDNVFIGVSGGVIGLGNSTSEWRKRKGMTGMLSIGKWFSAPAGLRLSVGGTTLRQQTGQDRRNGVIADLDYMWNLNSAFVGYNPDSKIETNVVLGASAVYLSGEGKKFFPGVHAGLQGIWKVSPSVGLYLEPNVRVFDKKITATSSHYAFMPGVNVGLVYRFNSSESYDYYKSSFDYGEFLSSRRYFFDLLGGVLMRSREWYPSFATTISFGKWYTPESAWRISGEYETIRKGSNYRSLALSADYMLSLSTLAGGYDSERSFDLDAFVGMTAGVANYNHGRNSIIWGPRAGLRGRISVSPAVDIIFEPQLQLLSIPDYTRRYNPEVRFLAGVSYKLNRSKSERTASTVGILSGELQPYINLAGSPMLYSESISHPSLRKVSGGFSLAAGGWLTGASGLQLGFAYDCLPFNSRSNQEIKTVSLDYMLNLTNVFTGETGRRFEVIPMLGLGVGWGSCQNSKAALAIEGGIRAGYRITDNLDLTLTPMVTVWQPRINGTRYNNHHFVGVGRLPVGISYRF